MSALFHVEVNGNERAGVWHIKHVISITALLETTLVNIPLGCVFQYMRNQEPLSVNRSLAVRGVKYIVTEFYPLTGSYNIFF